MHSPTSVGATRRPINALTSVDLPDLIRPATGAGFAEVLRRLGAAGVPCAPVQTLPQVAADEQVAAIGVISPLPHERIAGFSVINLPVTFDGAYLPHQNPPPALGADTARVLAGLGRSPAQIAELLRAGVVQAQPSPSGSPVVNQ